MQCGVLSTGDRTSSSPRPRLAILLNTLRQAEAPLTLLSSANSTPEKENDSWNKVTGTFRLLDRGLTSTRRKKLIHARRYYPSLNSLSSRPHRVSSMRIRHAGHGVCICTQLGSALICCCSCPYTVDTAGHPTPGPCRFWSVDSSVEMRACWSPFELPVGNGAAIDGLFTMWPAATFAFRSCP